MTQKVLVAEDMIQRVLQDMTHRYPLSDWISNLGEWRTACGDPLRNAQLEIRYLDKIPPDTQDRHSGIPYKPRSSCGFYSGPETLTRDATGIISITQPCMIWYLRGPYVLFCTKEQGEELKATMAKNLQLAKTSLERRPLRSLVIG